MDGVFPRASQLNTYNWVVTINPAITELPNFHLALQCRKVNERCDRIFCLIFVIVYPTTQCMYVI